VAEFEPVPPQPQAAQSVAAAYRPQQQSQGSAHHTHQQHQQQHQYTLPPPPQHYVKTEPVDRPYVSLSTPVQMQQYVLPPITGPNQHPGQNGHQSVLVLPRGAPPQNSRPSSQSPAVGTGGGSGGRIPQLDGPSFIPAQDAGPSSASRATSSSKTKMPQLDGPSSSGSSSGTASPIPPPVTDPAAARATGSEEINSDLDDSDSDVDDEEDPTAAAGADVDIVFCTYDKVARVKNKWKCVLKDGMVHVNGKDYLFAKCNGEFEW